MLATVFDRRKAAGDDRLATYGWHGLGTLSTEVQSFCTADVLIQLSRYIAAADAQSFCICMLAVAAAAAAAYMHMPGVAEARASATAAALSQSHSACSEQA